MKTLAYDVSRCGGNSPRSGYVCPSRRDCARYRAFAEWDKAAGIPDYQGIAVMVAQPGCTELLEVEA